MNRYRPVSEGQTMYQVDFNKPVHAYFMGIGGISMSGLAEILLGRNFPVSGSDMKDSDTVEALRSKGAKIFIGYTSASIKSRL